MTTPSPLSLLAGMAKNLRKACEVAGFTFDSNDPELVDMPAGLEPLDVARYWRSRHAGMVILRDAERNRNAALTVARIDAVKARDAALVIAAKVPGLESEVVRLTNENESLRSKLPEVVSEMEAKRRAELEAAIAKAQAELAKLSEA
jgi:hypothetical protein